MYEGSDQVYVTRKDRLKGRVDAVTVISPPGGTSCETFMLKFGRVASSNCGGAWRYIWVVGVDSDGFLI